MMKNQRKQSSFFSSRRLGPLILAIGVSLALPACRPGGDRAGQREGLTIAFIPMGTTHEFWKAIHAGALTASRELGVQIIWKGPINEDDRSEQIRIVEDLTGSGVDAVIISPLDDRALIRPVIEAKKTGIPVVIFNSALQGENHDSFIATDNYKGGCVAAEHLGKLMNGRGTVIMVRLKEGVEGTMKREQGFLDTIRAKFAGMEILSDNQYAGPSTEGAYQTVENLLSRFPDVESFFMPNESTTFGCLRALQDHGLAGKVILVGFDSSRKLVEALEKKEIAALVLQDPFEMGYRSVKTAVDCVKGRPFEKRVDTGVYLALPENRHDPKIARLLEPDLSILDR